MFAMVRYFDTVFHVKVDPNQDLLQEWKTVADGVSFDVDLQNPIDEHEVDAYMSPQNPDTITKHEKADGKLVFLPNPVYQNAATKYAFEEIVENLSHYRLTKDLFTPLCHACRYPVKKDDQVKKVDQAELVPLDLTELAFKLAMDLTDPITEMTARDELQLVRLQETKFVKLRNMLARRSIFIRWTNNQSDVRQFYVDLKRHADDYPELTLDITKKYRKSAAFRTDVVKDCQFNYSSVMKQLKEERKHEHLMRLFKEKGIEQFVVEE